MPHETNKKTRKEYLEDAKRISITTKRMLGYMFRNSPHLTSAVIVALILIAAFPFAFAYMTGIVIDQIVAVTTQQADSQLLFTYVGLTIVLVLLRGILDTLHGYFDIKLTYAISRAFNEDVTEKFAYLDIEYYENPETNVTLQKVAENYGHRPLNFMSVILNFINPVISIASGTIILFAFSPVLILIILLSTGPSFFNNVIFGRKKWGIWAAKGPLRRDYTKSRQHLIREGSLMELKVFKTREYLLKRVSDLFNKFQDEQIKVEDKRVITNTALNIISTGGFGFAYFTMVVATVASKITIGQFNFYFGTVRQLSSGFNEMFRRAAGIYEHGLYLADIFEFLDMPAKVISGEKCLPSMDKPPTIEFKNLTFNYPGSREKVIKDLNLTIQPKEHIAIVGENGAGKSTLIKILMRFYDVHEGNVLIDGIDLKNLDIENWYSHVGTLFQDFNRYHFDARTNIGVGNAEKLEELDEIIDAAKHTGADEFIQKYENKYNQILSKAFEGGISPSVGQWQKIALARAFFKNAPILILDEPTSAIDPKAEAKIFENLFEFAKEKTVIIISHRFSTVRNASRIIVLEDGAIIEQGTHEELLSIPEGKYKTAFEIQRKGYE